MDAKERIIEQRSERRKRRALVMKSIIAFLILLALVLVIVIVREGWSEGLFTEATLHVADMLGIDSSLLQENEDEVLFPGQNADEQNQSVSWDDPVLGKAALLAMQYDYSGAVQLLKESRGYRSKQSYQDAAAEYQVAGDSCVLFPLDQITHVFVHTLIVDTDKAFDGDEDEAGYNQVMTTVDEFNRMLEEMYARGYVMVSPHDMCEVHKDGSVTKKEIFLPEGKKAFVLSQDDVSYYHYMDGDGFAEKLIVAEDGSIQNTYIEDDGSVSVGAYDMVPIVDAFVREHPDFSYHGHKGVVALTGYEGVLGYRTDEVYKTRKEEDLTEYQRAFFEANPDFNWKAEVKEAKKVAAAMKEDGWEFASHTWGHINPLGSGYDATVTDTEKWLKNVAPVVGDTDILIFAFGADINDWQPYTHENPYFSFLKKKGFSIYCNVDGSQIAWVQFGDDFMRQGRRNLDGYRMYYNPDMLEDLFDTSYVWDDARPVPVPRMGSMAVSSDEGGEEDGSGGTDDGSGDDTWTDDGSGDDAWTDDGSGDGTWTDDGSGDGTWTDDGSGDGGWTDDGSGDGTWTGDGSWTDGQEADITILE